MTRTVYRVRGGCVYCLTCRDVCPADAVTIDAEGAHIDPERCIACGACKNNCPAEAIEIVEHDGRGGSEE